MLPDQLETIFHRLLKQLAPAPAAQAECDDQTGVEPRTLCEGRHPSGLEPRRFTGLTGPQGYLARMAYYEAASVQAFVQLADELNRHGAPEHLVRAAQAAAREEVSHAQVCSALARRRGASPPAPTVGKPYACRTLEAIALENATEGCVREAFGALIGLYQSRSATAADVRAAMARIASDEAAHAAFSFQLARWLDTRLTPQSQERVKRAREKALSALLEQALFFDDVSWRAEIGLPHTDTLFELAQGFQRELAAA